MAHRLGGDHTAGCRIAVSVVVGVVYLLDGQSHLHRPAHANVVEGGLGNIEVVGTLLAGTNVDSDVRMGLAQRGYLRLREPVDEIDLTGLQSNQAGSRVGDDQDPERVGIR